MRTELQKRNGQRGEFEATFERYGRTTVKIPNIYGRGRARDMEVVTLLFKDVKDSTGAVVTDHLWFKSCKQWAALGLKPGDQVRFEARVMPYEKGYVGRYEDESGRVTDYKLAFPASAHSPLQCSSKMFTPHRGFHQPFLPKTFPQVMHRRKRRKIDSMTPPSGARM